MTGDLTGEITTLHGSQQVVGPHGSRCLLVALSPGGSLGEKFVRCVAALPHAIVTALGVRCANGFECVHGLGRAGTERALSPKQGLPLPRPGTAPAAAPPRSSEAIMARASSKKEKKEPVRALFASALFAATVAAPRQAADPCSLRLCPVCGAKLTTLFAAITATPFSLVAVSEG